MGGTRKTSRKIAGVQRSFAILRRRNGKHKLHRNFRKNSKNPPRNAHALFTFPRAIPMESEKNCTAYVGKETGACMVRSVVSRLNSGSDWTQSLAPAWCTGGCRCKSFNDHIFRIHSRKFVRSILQYMVRVEVQIGYFV